MSLKRSIALPTDLLFDAARHQSAGQCGAEAAVVMGISRATVYRKLGSGRAR